MGGTGSERQVPGGGFRVVTSGCYLTPTNPRPSARVGARAIRRGRIRPFLRLQATDATGRRTDFTSGPTAIGPNLVFGNCYFSTGYKTFESCSVTVLQDAENSLNSRPFHRGGIFDPVIGPAYFSAQPLNGKGPRSDWIGPTTSGPTVIGPGSIF